MFQDTMKEFFTQRSASDRGTLYNIKQRFRLRSVRSDVMNNYNNVVELLDLATEGLVCLRATDFLQIPNIDSEKGNYLSWLCSHQTCM